MIKLRDVNFAIEEGVSDPLMLAKKKRSVDADVDAATVAAARFVLGAGAPTMALSTADQLVGVRQLKAAARTVSLLDERSRRMQESKFYDFSRVAPVDEIFAPPGPDDVKVCLSTETICGPNVFNIQLGEYWVGGESHAHCSTTANISLAARREIVARQPYDRF